jgi:hypothetical protein
LSVTTESASKKAGLHVFRAALDAQIRGDGTYAWLLRFPGTPPGASFKTMPGDDLAAVLDSVLPQDLSAWEALLAHTGEIDVHLFGLAVRRVPLGTRIAWWRGDHRWRPGITNVQFALPTIRVRRLLPSSGYEVMRIRDGGAERVAGPVARFEDARRAMVAEVAKLIDRFQRGEKIKGMSGMFQIGRAHV